MRATPAANALSPQGPGKPHLLWLPLTKALQGTGVGGTLAFMPHGQEVQFWREFGGDRKTGKIQRIISSPFGLPAFFPLNLGG